MPATYEGSVVTLQLPSAIIYESPPPLQIIPATSKIGRQIQSPPPPNKITTGVGGCILCGPIYEVDNARCVGSIRVAAATWVPPSVASKDILYAYHVMDIDKTIASSNPTMQKSRPHTIAMVMCTTADKRSVSNVLFHTKIYINENIPEIVAFKKRHKRENNRRVNDRVMQSKEGKVDSRYTLDAGLVVTESNETETERHVLSSKSGKDTHAEDPRNSTPWNDKQFH
ncbi:hypothetical protein Tco_1018285 [Tanacetum coccineum]|uniref:Uncharacterized protein n=1 Tax=Tanacetum coccineum TaxID=301880 RepID=A0ABQ5FU31_9ASTR